MTGQTTADGQQQFTVFLTAPATIGVTVTAATADEAEDIAQREHSGPNTSGPFVFGTWDVAAGETEPYGPASVGDFDGLLPHLRAKRHAQWVKTQRALAVAPDAAMTSPVPAGTLRDELAEFIRDELAHWPLGSGYYATSVDVGAAMEMTDALLPAIDAYVARVVAEARADELEQAADPHPAPPSEADSAGEAADRVRQFLDAYEEGTSGDRSEVYRYNQIKLTVADLRTILAASSGVRGGDGQARSAVRQAADVLSDRELGDALDGWYRSRQDDEQTGDTTGGQARFVVTVRAGDAPSAERVAHAAAELVTAEFGATVQHLNHGDEQARERLARWFADREVPGGWDQTLGWRGGSGMRQEWLSRAADALRAAGGGQP